MGEDNIYARRHDMLLEYKSRQKHLWLTMLLCAGLGGLGVHRLYLGHYKIAAMICCVFLVALFFTLAGGVHPPLMVGAPVAGLVYYVIVIFELYFATNAADRENKRIRENLEIKYGL